MRNGILVVHKMKKKKLKSKSKIYLVQLLTNLKIRSVQKKVKMLKKLAQTLNVGIKEFNQSKTQQSNYYPQTSKYKSAEKKKKRNLKKRTKTTKIHGKMKSQKVGKMTNKLCKFKQ
jgi:hypothetical protein